MTTPPVSVKFVRELAAPTVMMIDGDNKRRQVTLAWWAIERAAGRAKQPGIAAIAKQMHNALDADTISADEGCDRLTDIVEAMEESQCADGEPHVAYYDAGLSFVWDNYSIAAQVCPGGYGEPWHDLLLIPQDDLAVSDFGPLCDEYVKANRR